MLIYLYIFYITNLLSSKMFTSNNTEKILKKGNIVKICM